jgi:hypothetical protein
MLIWVLVALGQTVKKPRMASYDMNKPSEIVYLPALLNEVSGISFLKGNSFVLEEDEHGLLYIYNFTKREVSNGYRFADNGDYEDVCVLGDRVYVLKSNGDLYGMRLSELGRSAAEQVKTKLSSANDCEGLCADASGDLWIACKGSAALDGSNIVGMRALYKFQMGKRKLKKNPVLLNEELVSLIKPANNVACSEASFAPSGIARHPLTGDFYVLAHKGKCLLVLDASFGIKAKYCLDKKLFRQPEGICFAPNGDLYITNEADGEQATILLFRMLP